MAGTTPPTTATVTAVEAVLRSGCTVYQYRRDDGLPGGGLLRGAPPDTHDRGQFLARVATTILRIH